MSDLVNALVAAHRLSAAHGEGHAREYLTTLSDPESNSLGKCLRRLGWWFPDDQQSPQERLVGWLFRDDVKRLGFSDGTERYRVETPEERIREATEGVESLARAVTIEADSCLAVASYVRVLLSETGRNNPPLYRRWRRGWPSEFSRENPAEGMRNVTDDPVFHEEMRFDEFCFRFDGELLDAALSAAATRLGLPSGRLKFREATGHPLNDELYARRDLVSWLESWRDGIMRTAWERQELPPGWEATDTTWPTSPITTVEHLREWLSSWLAGIHRARTSSWGSPELYLDDVQRELRNTRRAMRAWGVSLPAKFNDNPADIHEAERQLEALTDSLPEWSGDASTPTVAPAEPDFPLDWEFQYGSILTPLEGTFETTANGLRLREDKVVPPQPVRNPVELMKHIQRWAATFRETRRELERAKEVKADAQTIAEWTARLLDETQRELRNTRRAMRAWGISLPPKFDDEPDDINKAEKQLETLIDGFAPPAGGTTNEADIEPPKPVEHKSKSHLAGVQFPLEFRLAWPEYPYRVEQFTVMHKAQRCPTDGDDFSWLGTFWNSESTSLNRLCGEPNAGSIVSYESSAKPQMFYVFTDDEVSVLRESFPQCSYVEDLRLIHVEAYLLSNGCEPNGRSAKSLVGLLAEILNKRKAALAATQKAELTDDEPKLQVDVLPAGDDTAGGQAEAIGKPTKRKKRGVDRTKEELFKAALKTHHKYETGGSVLNVEPVTTRQVEELTQKGISDSTAGRLLAKHFGTVEKYRDACFSGAIGPKLVVLLGDGLHAFGSFDATERDIEDQNDNDSDE